MESINDGLSNDGKILLWYSLSPDTRMNYASAIKSYEYFCSTRINTLPYSATNRALEEWTVSRLIGSTDTLLSRVKADTMLAYLSAVKSHHIDRGHGTQAFDNPRLERLIKGARRSFPQVKAQRLPITKPILTAITSESPDTIEKLNIDTAFKLAFAGFLRMGEYTYTATQAKRKAFQAKQLTRSDVAFFHSHAVLRLKDSKTDVNHTGAEIVIAKTGEPTCAYHALQELYRRDQKPASAPLFSLNSGAFPRQFLINILQRRLTAAGIQSSKSFTGHSFHKGAAQHAADNGMLEEHIKKLGRWTSEAFRLYFQTSAESLYGLSLRFQTGKVGSFDYYQRQAVLAQRVQTTEPIFGHAISS